MQITTGAIQLYRAVASVSWRWQTGIVQNYAVTLVLGLIVILGYLLMR